MAHRFHQCDFSVTELATAYSIKRRWNQPECGCQLPHSGLAPGATINVQFPFGVLAGGNLYAVTNTEA